MKSKQLNYLINNKIAVNEKIKEYKNKKIIKKEKIEENEIKGHLQKAEHNLNFIKDNLKLGYFDWCITGCYYAIYHASLALILAKGFISKNHDATLILLIKEYYKKGLNEKEVELFNQFFLDYHDLLFYLNSKNKREKASYSGSYIFDKKIVNDLRLESILFVNKVKNILKDYNV